MNKSNKSTLFTRKNNRTITYLVFSIFVSFSLPSHAQSPGFPVPDWPTDLPENRGFDSNLLQQNTSNYAQSINSDSLLVIKDGHIIWEEYWNGNSQTGPEKNVWSVTKSFTAILVGIAQDMGYLSIDDKASDYISEWQSSASEPVTVKQLLSNTSGRYHDILRDSWQFRREDSVGKSDMTQFAIGQRQQDTPGTTWKYNNLAIQTLDRVISVATGQDTANFALTALIEPLGMNNTTPFTDSKGQMIMPSHLRTVSRDMAKLGYLFLNNGNWDGHQILPQNYVAEAISESSSLNEAYGYLWWLNTDETQTWRHPGESRNAPQTGKIYPDAPTDVYAASGNNGQVVIVSPSENLIIVRQGHESIHGPEVINNLYRETASAMIP